MLSIIFENTKHLKGLNFSARPNFLFPDCYKTNIRLFYSEGINNFTLPLEFNLGFRFQTDSCYLTIVDAYFRPADDGHPGHYEKLSEAACSKTHKWLVSNKGSDGTNIVLALDLKSDEGDTTTTLHELKVGKRFKNKLSINYDFAKGNDLVERFKDQECFIVAFPEEVQLNSIIAMFDRDDVRIARCLGDNCFLVGRQVEHLDRFARNVTRLGGRFAMTNEKEYV